MDVSGSARLDHPVEAALPVIADLGTYPSWLRIVRAAEPAVPHPGDEGGPAWMVELGGRLGPFGRTKRVRMVRVLDGDRGPVRFERLEHDGRQHGAWVLTGELEPVEGACSVRMALHYGGSRWLPVLDAVLR